MTYIVDSQPDTDCGWHTQQAEVDGKSASDGQALPSKLASSSQHISNIVLPVFHLEIMEDVFSLLFSRIEHLRDSEDSPECQSDSEPENRNGQKHPGFEFDESAVSIHCESISDVFDAAAATHEIFPVENPRVGALTAESRCSPMEASSSSIDGRSDELSGSQTVSNSSVHCGNESGFLARDYMIRDVLILLHDCCKELSSELAANADDVKSMHRHRQTADLQLTVLTQRVETLRQHITDAQWRLRITVPPSAGVSEQRQPKQRRQRNKRHRDSVTRKESDAYSTNSDIAQMANSVVPKMLCRPESLLNLCLAEGRIADAEEIVKVCQLGILLNVNSVVSCVY